MSSLHLSARVGRPLVIALVILAACLAFASQQHTAVSQSSNSHSPIQVPIKHLRESTSTNWSGYAELTSLTSPQTGSVTAVSGTWTVPAVNCSVTANGYSSTWVGIDGYSSSSVEQLGTEQDCSSGSPSYYAWYEMYPRYPYSIPYAVSPGDSITASVRYSGNSYFVLSMRDNTKGWNYSTTQRLTNTARSSAEWIEEAPSSGSTLPLADFQTVNFSNASATINGVTSAISTHPNDPITMVDGSATATPGGLSAGGTAFSVVFSTATPPPPPVTATMHVASIQYSYRYSTLYITIAVQNSSGVGVSGANVGISLTDASAGRTWTGSGTTGSGGTITFRLYYPPAGTYSTTITSLTASGLTWDGVSPANSYYVP